MKKYQNEGVIDRGARLLIGELFLLIAYFWVGGGLSVVLYVLGVISIITALTGFCGLYKVLGINPELTLIDPTGRPTSALEQAQPIVELS